MTIGAPLNLSQSFPQRMPPIYFKMTASVQSTNGPARGLPAYEPTGTARGWGWHGTFLVTCRGSACGRWVKRPEGDRHLDVTPRARV